MKTLILILSFTTFAYATDPNEISDPQIARQLVGAAQDIKNEKVISEVPDLQPCQEAYQRKGADKKDDPQTIADLDQCIQRQFVSKSPDQIASLSDKLNLVSYNLIPSKTVKNVTKYLTQKLYQSLTGVDIEEQDVKKKLQAMKFNVKKQVDHKDFYELYKNQVAKNALYEVSRFCLVDFRRSSPVRSGSTFVDHWGDLNDFANTSDPSFAAPGATWSVTDNGKADDFEQPNSSTGAVTADSSYRDIMKNIFNGGTTLPDAKKLSNFFFFCGKKINELCENYEKSCQNTPGNRACNSQASSLTSGTQPTKPYVIGGSKACISKARLTAYKKAMKASEDIITEFASNPGQNIRLRLDRDEMVKQFQGGVGSDKSLNQLTNNASADFFKATANDSAQEAQNCIQNPGADCDEFVVVSDAETRIEQNTNLLYLAKRQAEMARVKDLKTKGGQALDSYLEKYYPDLKGKNLSAAQLEEAISQRWDAKREGMIAEIQARIGTRQLTAGQANQNATVAGFANKKEETAVNNAKASLTEKQRLAQVVFFNNIVSSTLKLKDSSGTDRGSNRQALTNELDAGEKEVKGDVFKNLRTIGATTSGSSGGSSGGLSGNESVTNIDFLDEFIGIPSDSTKSRGTASTPPN